MIKYNSSGSLVWACSMGSSDINNGEEAGTAIALSGNDIYISGYISSGTAIDMDPSSNTNTISGIGARDVFIAKYDGNFTPSSTSFYKWAFAIGGAAGSDVGIGIAVSGNDVYITGYINGTTAIDMDPSSNTNNITGAGGSDIFVAKYDGSLTPSSTSFYKWAFRAGGSSDDGGSSLAISGNDVYLTGRIDGTTAIDMDPSTNTNNITGAGGYDIFVAKYDGSLTPSSASFYTWAFNLGGADYEVATGLAVSGTDVYVTGYLENLSAIDMDPSTNTNNITGDGGGNFDIFVAKYDGSLTPSNTSFYKWAFDAGGNDSDVAYGIAISGTDICITGYYLSNDTDFDPDGSIYALPWGSSGGNSFVAKYGAINPLPVTWLSFDATAIENKEVLCSWSCASEQNNDYFTIERSSNAINFENVGIVNGSGNSTSTTNYSFTDTNPYSGTSYYRIKQTDYDGKYDYTNIQAVTINESTSFEFNVYPNPTNNKNLNVYIKGQSGDNIEIVIQDVLGQKYYSKNVVMKDESLALKIDTENNLPSGVYIISAKSNNELFSKKVVIK